MNMVKCETRTTTRSITQTQSTTLVKNLFRAAFASVAYIRDLFDEEFFGESNIGPTRCFKFVKLDREDVKVFADWLERGVFDALQKQYLDIVLLQIYETATPKKGRKRASTKGSLLETYSFQVAYDKNGNAQFMLSGANSGTQVPSCKENIKNNCSQVILSIIRLTHSLRPLPSNRIISMKLLYTDNTPDGYEPPMFSKAEESEFSWFEDQPIQVEAGAIRTPFHELSVNIRARPSEENKFHNVLTAAADAENMANPASPTPNNDTDFNVSAVDVGGSTGNSGRVPPRCMRETQEANDDSDIAVPARLRVRRPVRRAAASSKGNKNNQVAGAPNGKGGRAKKRKGSKVKKDVVQIGRRVKARNN